LKSKTKVLDEFHVPFKTEILQRTRDVCCFEFVHVDVCVCVRARAGRAMLVGHSVNDLCKFLLSPFKKKNKRGGCFKRVATFCSLALWRAALEGIVPLRLISFIVGAGSGIATG